MITVNTLKQFKTEQKKITMLTCYDASFATLLDKCGIDVLLVGDSLGMVIQGKKSTLPVQLKDICYHTRCVANGTKNALIVSDLPFGSYENNKQQSFYTASKLLKHGANMVKLEGGEWLAETTHFLQQRSIPVCAHIGLMPQSVNKLGGYKVQGRGISAKQLMQDAKAHDEAGASLLVMECIPIGLAKKITESVSCPTIGIGAGRFCDGQVLVLQDMLDIYQGKKAKFVKNFMLGQTSIENAIKTYIYEVVNLIYPDLEHSFLE